MKLHTKRTGVLFLAISILPAGIFTFSYLHAQEASSLYQKEEVKLMEGELQEVVIQQEDQVIASCQYPSMANQELCDGFVQKEDGIYRNGNALPGEMSDTGFQAYSYFIQYKEEQETKEQRIEIERTAESAITMFAGSEIQADTWTTLSVLGDAHQVEFTCEQPGVELQDGRVKADSSLTSFEIKASDDGNATKAGGEIRARFTVVPKETNNKEENIASQKEGKQEEAPSAPYATTFDDLIRWTEGIWTEKSTFELTNTKDTYNSNYNKLVRLEGQFVDLSDANSKLPAGKSPLQLTRDEVDTLFQNAIQINGSAFENLYPHTYAYDKVWRENLTQKWPSEEGIYLYRYRLFDSFGFNVIWDNNLDSDTIVSKEDGWIYDVKSPVLLIGQDFSPPDIVIKAKKAGESEAHILQEEEILDAGDTLFIEASDSISDISALRYRLIKDEQGTSVSFTSADDPHHVEVPLPADFKGGTIEVEAENGNKTRGLAQKSSHIVSNVDYVTISLPDSSNIWKSDTSAILRLNEPKQYTLNYDAVRIRFDGITEETRYIEREAFVNNGFTQEINLPNGDYTVQAEIVKKQGDTYEEIQDAQHFTSELKIDHTATLAVQKLAKKNQIQPLQLQAASGPSNLKEIKVSCTNSANETWEKTIPISGYRDTFTYSDQMAFNGTCSYTAYNHANMASSVQSITVHDLSNSEPDLDLIVHDKLGTLIKSGEPAQQYVTLQAVNRNPDFTGSIQICGIEDTCIDYRLGRVFTIRENTTITFKNEASGNMLASFEVVIADDKNMGTIHIDNEENYGKSIWSAEDQSIHATLQNGDANAYLAYQIDEQSVVKTGKKEANVSIHQPKETSASHTIRFFSYVDDKASKEKYVYVNIDKVTPTLHLQAEKNLIKSSATTGASGIAKLEMDGADGFVDITSYVQADGTIRDYPAQHNGTYRMRLTTHAGTQAEEAVRITSIDEDSFHINVKSDDKVYDGSWTKEDIEIRWDGGYRDTDNFDHYECRIGEGAWETCTSPKTITTEMEEAIIIRSIDSAGQMIKKSDPIKVKIDKTAPSMPNFEFQTIHSDSLSNFVRTISFSKWFNEEIEVSITSVDAKDPNVLLYYQEADEQGKFDSDLTSERWKAYSKKLTYATERSILLSAYACDEAGNCSGAIDSDGVLLDFTSPILSGIKDTETSGYIPRVISYNDALSGIHDELSTLKLDTEEVELKQNLLIKRIGTYCFDLYDLANNTTHKEFTLKKIPSPEDMDGSQDEKDLIDEIEKEFKEHKNALDEDTRSDTEKQIEDMKDAFDKNRVDHLEDTETGAIMEGLDGTTFPKDAILKVRRISDELTQEEQASFDKVFDPNENQLLDVYEVTLFQDDAPIDIVGSALVRFTYPRNVADVLYATDKSVFIPFEQEVDQMKLTITQTGRYLLFDQPIVDKDPSYENPSNDGFGDYLTSVNTGVSQTTGVLLMMCILSGGIVYEILRNQKKE